MNRSYHTVTGYGITPVPVSSHKRPDLAVRKASSMNLNESRGLHYTAVIRIGDHFYRLIRHVSFKGYVYYSRDGEYVMA